MALKNNLLSSVSSISPYVMRSTGWDFNTEENWKKIIGKKCIVYHRDDEVIAIAVSLLQAIYGKDPATAFVEMDKRVAGSPHARHLTDNEADAIVNSVTTRVQQVALQAMTPLRAPQTAIRPTKSLKNRVIHILLDIFSALFFPLNLIAILFRQRLLQRFASAP